MVNILFFFIALPAVFGMTPIRECGAGQPLPIAVFFGGREAPCLTAPCSISRTSGRGVTYVDFVTNSAATTINPRVRASVFGITITQELPEEISRNPCGILTQGFSCPLRANEAAAYRLELPVDPLTPLISSDTEITLFGDNQEVIFCYRLQTRIVA